MIKSNRDLLNKLYSLIPVGLLLFDMRNDVNRFERQILRLLRSVCRFSEVHKHSRRNAQVQREGKHELGQTFVGERQRSGAQRVSGVRRRR